MVSLCMCRIKAPLNSSPSSEAAGAVSIGSKNGDWHRSEAEPILV
jgi:hypothetical protein